MKDYDRWFKIEMHQKEAGRYLFLVILENDRRYCGLIGNVFKNSSLMCSRSEICLGTLNVLNLFFVFPNILKNNFYSWYFIFNNFPYLYNHILKQSTRKQTKTSENNLLKKKVKQLKTIKICSKKDRLFQNKFSKICFLSRNYWMCFWI